MGRAPGSLIRQQMVDILSVLGKATGYDIYKVYRAVFGTVSIRSIYYHLQKGVLLDIFVMAEVTQEKGDFSWGSSVEKKYYSLSRKARAGDVSEIRRYLQGTP